MRRRRRSACLCPPCYWCGRPDETRWRFGAWLCPACHGMHLAPDGRMARVIDDLPGPLRRRLLPGGM